MPRIPDPTQATRQGAADVPPFRGPFRNEAKMLDRADLESRIESLSRSLDDLRPPGAVDRRLAPLVVIDRIDHLGRYLYVDRIAEDLLGFPPEYYETEIDWVRYNHRLDIERVAVLWDAALRGRRIRGIEYRTDHVDGHWVWLEDSFTPILSDRSGRSLVIEGRWRDITPRKRREIEFLLEGLEDSLRMLKSAPVSGRTVVLRYSGSRSRTGDLSPRAPRTPRGGRPGPSGWT